MDIPGGPVAVDVGLCEAKGVKPLQLSVVGAEKFCEFLRGQATIAEDQARDVSFEMTRGGQTWTLSASPDETRAWAASIEAGVALGSERRRLAGCAPVRRVDTIKRDQAHEIERVTTEFQY